MTGWTLWYGSVLVLCKGEENTMKMKLRETQVRLQNLAKLGTKTFPAKLSFAISCNIEKLQKEAEHIEKERKKLCEQYAEKDDDGKPVMVDSVLNGKESKEYKMDGINHNI